MSTENTDADKRLTFSDKIFKDKKGRIVLAEAPNLPLIVWFTMTLLAYPLTGKAALLSSVAARTALFIWAWLELFKGVNYFRRGLGLTILLYILWGFVARGTFL